MRKVFTLLLSVLLISCLSETNVDPGTATTFIRYFNGGNNDEAKGLELSPDGGYMILATTRIQKAEADIPRTKIKLIKTDAAGNPLFQVLFPGFTDETRDYLASSIQATPGGGYIVVGDVIQKDSISKTFVLKVSEDGVKEDSLDLQFAYGMPEKGTAVGVDASGNYVVLSTGDDMRMTLSQLDQDLTVISKRNHPITADGAYGFARRLLITSTGRAVISGMRQVSGLTGVRLLQILPDSPVADWDLFYNEPGYSLSGFDFCRYGQGFAIAGATNQKPDGSAGTTTDVMFIKTDQDGNMIGAPVTFPFDNPDTPEDEDSQSDVGNAISGTQDGGLIFFSSISSDAIDGRGDTEFYLIKIDGFGNKVWTSSFGSKFKDEAVAVRQLSDGTYVALGTTTQGALKILTLFRTNKDGKIE